VLYGGVRQLVIGLTGSFGSGCSTVTETLSERFGFKRFSMSSPIRDVWASGNHGADRTRAPRAELQATGNEGRQTNGLDYWARQVANAVPEREALVVIDSIRNEGEVEFLRSRFPNFFLIAVLCSPEERWLRVRTQYADLGLHEEDFVIDDERDKIEEVEYGQQVAACVDEADLVISNQTSQPSRAAAQAALVEPLSLYVGLLSGESPIAPKSDEVAMTIAYAQSRRSFCLKRHVGAVIADQRGDIVSTGFNENPSTMAPCYVEFQYCFKDSMMMKALKGTVCPGCSSVLGEVHEPFKCPECSEDLKLRYFPDRGMRWCTALHAEERALLNSSGSDIEDGVLYTTAFPCFNCARQIAQAGISKVIYVEPYPQLDVLPFLERNGITVEPFQGVKARAFERLFSQFRQVMESKYRLGGAK
jgi:deoxycytidylate deaminase